MIIQAKCRITVDAEDSITGKAKVYVKKIALDVFEVNMFHEWLDKGTLRLYFNDGTDAVIEYGFDDFYKLWMQAIEEHTDNGSWYIEFTKN